LSETPLRIDGPASLSEALNDPDGGLRCAVLQGLSGNLAAAEKYASFAPRLAERVLQLPGGPERLLSLTAVLAMGASEGMQCAEHVLLNDPCADEVQVGFARLALASPLSRRDILEKLLDGPTATRAADLLAEHEDLSPELALRVALLASKDLTYPAPDRFPELWEEALNGPHRHRARQLLGIVPAGEPARMQPPQAQPLPSIAQLSHPDWRERSRAHRLWVSRGRENAGELRAALDGPHRLEAAQVLLDCGLDDLLGEWARARGFH
jgi:hypothetical protein